MSNQTTSSKSIKKMAMVGLFAILAMFVAYTVFDTVLMGGSTHGQNAFAKHSTKHSKVSNGAVAAVAELSTPAFA